MHARVSAYRGTSVDPVDEIRRRRADPPPPLSRNQLNVQPQLWSTTRPRAFMEAVGPPRANRLQSAISGR